MSYKKPSQLQTQRTKMMEDRTTWAPATVASWLHLKCKLSVPVVQEVEASMIDGLVFGEIVKSRDHEALKVTLKHSPYQPTLTHAHLAHTSSICESLSVAVADKASVYSFGNPTHPRDKFDTTVP